MLQKHFIFPSLKYHENCVYQFFPIMIRNIKIDRQHLLEHLFDKGIDTRVLLNLTDQPIFKQLYGEKTRYEYPKSHYANDFGFIVGCHQDLDELNMRYITTTLFEYVNKLEEIK